MKILQLIKLPPYVFFRQIKNVLRLLYEVKKNIFVLSILSCLCTKFFSDAFIAIMTKLYTAFSKTN